MTDYETSLLPIFYELRRLGLPLGVHDYLLAMEALHVGIGLDDTTSLKSLCNLLWAKSKEDQEMIDVVFSVAIEAHLQPLQEDLHLSSDKPDQTPSIPPSAYHDLLSYNHDAPSIEKPEHYQTFRSVPLQQTPKKTSHSSLETKKYFMTPRLPLDRREMISIGRRLQRFQRTGLPEELDIEGTIQRISQTGLFLGPVLRPVRRNQAQLVLLLDQGGSMIPFSLLIEAMMESFLQSGLANNIHIYYFHDCPEGIVYERPEMTGIVSLTDILATYATDSAVLIVSDAGAARGFYENRRVMETKRFVKTLKSYTYLYAWLNPMPPDRWISTTAEDIACIMPMFPFTRDGLIDAIAILQGHPFPSEVSMNE